MKSPIEQYVIDRVREKRLEQKVSQAELASWLNVSRGFIGDVENPNKRAKYNLNHLNVIARYLNCSLWDLIPDNPLPSPENK